MTLHVPFDQFAKTVQRLLDTKEAYLTPRGKGTLVTAAPGSNGILIASHADQSLSAAKAKLVKAGLEVYEGTWSQSEACDEEEEGNREAYIAAVSYKSAESMPGVWIDAFPIRPTQVQVLRALYDEFRETGELPEVSFEEFVRLGEPNVAIAGPTEIQSYLDKKVDCP